MAKYSFDIIDAGDFSYVYSPIVKSYPVFEKEANCLVNRFDSEIDDFEYISIVSKKEYNKAKITVECDFHKYGAPLIVWSGDVSEKEGRDGKTHLFYGVHFEAVAWEKGLNLWYIVPFPEREEHPVKPTKLLGAEFKIEAGSRIIMSAEIEKGKAVITVNGNSYTVEHEAMPQSFHVGYTACEGINRLYSMKIE